MNHLRKKSISALVITGVVLLFCAFLLCFDSGSAVRTVPNLGIAPAADNIDVSIPNASSFSNSELGLYLCRPATPSATKIYTGTISTEDLIDADSRDEFYPEFKALKRHHDQWEDITNDEDPDFWFEADDKTNCSVRWCLKETAPAAVYGVRCTYAGNDEDNDPKEFLILYTDDWTYINVTEKDTGVRRITNFVGGDEKTLYLDVTFNDGAANPILGESDEKLSTGVVIGRLIDGDIVSTRPMQVTVRTVSGRTYTDFDVDYDRNQANRVLLKFNSRLSNEIYMVQFTSSADNRIIGQFIIDNSRMNSGVNLSQIWVVLMVFGGLLTLGAASAYLVPLFIVRINEARVYKENERIARMKNPEAYASKKKKSIKEVLDKVIYNIKTPAYKRQKDVKQEEKTAEEKAHSNRFTEMLRERQEKRDYMREHNVTHEEMEKIKEAEAAAAADKANSFATLRDDDDDDEIATFHAAEDEVSTLETGAYVKDGTMFAKLDSMRDEEQPQDNDVDDGNNENGGN